ncbi:MAG: hypothetical protein KGH94_02805 [Candidatus Micrarchaeota archaeon]|nr:hypothetical protein [Candidatus Micrarchaeota archaeon]
MVKNLDVRVEVAYIELRRNLTIYFSLLLLSFIAATSLVVYGLLYYNTGLGRAWSAVVIFLLFIKLGYDAVEDMKRRYRQFKVDNALNDAMMKDI